MTPTPTPTPSPTPGEVFVQFSSRTFDVTEGCVPATLTVTLGNSALDHKIVASDSAVTVDYAIAGGTASQKSDYTYVAGTLIESVEAGAARKIVGRLVFAPGETSQTIQLLINEDGFAEGAETVDFTLSNPQGAALGTPITSTLTIIDNETVDSTTNPIDDPGNFVCQQYHDFLHRQPDETGLAFWTSQITQCGTDAACIDWMRTNVAMSFFLSIEYQETGYFVDRLYEACLRRHPAFEEFVVDMHVVGMGVEVGVGNWQQQLEDNKQKYAERLVRVNFCCGIQWECRPTTTWTRCLNTRGLFRQRKKDSQRLMSTAPATYEAARWRCARPSRARPSSAFTITRRLCKPSTLAICAVIQAIRRTTTGPAMTFGWPR